MLQGQPPGITHQGGYVVPGRQRLLKKLSPDATRGANDQDIHGLLQV
jgi:hypothetical protein